MNPPTTKLRLHDALAARSTSYAVRARTGATPFWHLDSAHAMYTGGEIFMYVVGHKPEPVQLHVQPPSRWRVVNGRTEHPDQHDWKYSNYELMIDNPTEIGPDWTEDDFKVDSKT